VTVSDRASIHVPRAPARVGRTHAVDMDVDNYDRSSRSGPEDTRPDSPRVQSPGTLIGPRDGGGVRLSAFTGGNLDLSTPEADSHTSWRTHAFSKAFQSVRLRVSRSNVAGR